MALIRVLLIFLLPTIIIADDFDLLLEKYMGELNPMYKNRLDISQIQDLYSYYSKYPLNINSAIITKLEDIPLVSREMFNQLQKKRPYTNKSQLFNAINSLPTDEFIKHILINTMTIDKSRKKREGTTYTVRNHSTIQKEDGFVREKYQGSRLDLYQKLNVKYDGLELSAISDKDAGELEVLDFTSVGLEYNYENLKMIAGDYNLFFGLGNLYDQSFLSLKGTDFINTSTEYGYGAKVNRSTLESNFFRGGFLEYTHNYNYFNNIVLRGFVGNTNRAATYKEEEGIVSSVYKSGYFRTETELQKKGILNEQLYGANVEANLNNISFGVLSTYLKYDIPISSNSFSTFQGQEGMLSSIYGNYNTDYTATKFETSFDINNNPSARLNYLNNVSDNVSFMIEGRYAHEDYRAPYASNFGEQSFVANEKAILTGLSYSRDKLDLSAFVDMYSTILNTFTTNQPVKGIQYFVNAFYGTSKTNYTLRLNYEQKDDSFRDDEVYNSRITVPNNKMHIRLEVNTKLTSTLSLRGRTEYSYTFNDIVDTESGNLIMLDIRKRDRGNNLYYGINYINFNTDSFESVVYAYQYQVPGLAYVYPFYNSGNSISAFVKYEPLEFLDVWVRLNHLFVNRDASIGSGYDEIDENNRTQLIFQLRFNFD